LVGTDELAMDFIRANTPSRATAGSVFLIQLRNGQHLAAGQRRRRQK